MMRGISPPVYGSACMNPAALITGGSRGIGRAIALALARAGWDFLINFRSNEQAARDTANECASQPRDREAPASRVETCQADISLPADRARLLQAMREKFGRLDLLVNNAGVAPTERVDILEAKEESFDRLISTNTK